MAVDHGRTTVGWVWMLPMEAIAVAHAVSVGRFRVVAARQQIGATAEIDGGGGGGEVCGVLR
jgi:hypothetical protein